MLEGHNVTQVNFGMNSKRKGAMCAYLLFIMQSVLFEAKKMFVKWAGRALNLVWFAHLPVTSQKPSQSIKLHELRKE